MTWNLIRNLIHIFSKCVCVGVCAGSCTDVGLVLTSLRDQHTPVLLAVLERKNTSGPLTEMKEIK